MVISEHRHRGGSNDCAYGKILTNRRSYVQIGLDIHICQVHQLEFQRLCIWKLDSIYDVEGWRTRLPRTHAGLPCVPIHMHILLSPDGHVMRAVHMHMQILHRLCKFRKFAQSRGRLCIFFSICTGFFIRWTCVFHDMCKFSITPNI